MEYPSSSGGGTSRSKTFLSRKEDFATVREWTIDDFMRGALKIKLNTACDCGAFDFNKPLVIGEDNS